MAQEEKAADDRRLSSLLAVFRCGFLLYHKSLIGQPHERVLDTPAVAPLTGLTADGAGG